MTLVKLAMRWLLGRFVAVGAMSSGFANPGDLPLGYRIASGAYPWTGRLHALAFKTAAISSSAVLTQWEAGERLDRQNIDTRHLYLSGNRMVPMRWAATSTMTRGGCSTTLRQPIPARRACRGCVATCGTTRCAHAIRGSATPHQTAHHGMAGYARRAATRLRRRDRPRTRRLSAACDAALRHPVARHGVIQTDRRGLRARCLGARRGHAN